MIRKYTKKASDKWIVKMINTNNIEDFRKYMNQIIFSFNCEHQNILPICGYYDFDQQQAIWKIYIKTPKMKCSLRTIIDQHIEKKELIPEKDIMQYLYDAIKGLLYLQKKKISHQNIKYTNLLLDEKGSIKITDFGITNVVAEENAGLSLHSAPEIYKKNDNSKKRELFKADCWSLGMILLEICSLTLDFGEFDKSEVDKQKCIKNKIQGLRGRYSDKLLELIASLSREEPSERSDLDDKRFLESHYPAITSLNSNDNTEESADIKRLESIKKELDTQIEETLVNNRKFLKINLIKYKSSQ